MTASLLFPRPRLQTTGHGVPLPEISPPITTPTRPYRTHNAMFIGTAGRAGAVATAIAVLSRSCDGLRSGIGV